MDRLVTDMNALCDAQIFGTSWHLVKLATGTSAGRDADIPVPSASTRKTSIMMAVLAQVAAGRLDLDERITIEPRHADGVASGVLRYMTPGLVIPFRDAIVQMIITSDNVATRIVMERIDRDALNEWCGRAGMTGTVHRFDIPPLGMPWDHPLDAVTTTTPADQTLLLQHILDGAADQDAAARIGCTAPLCAWALEVLSWQIYRNMIPSRLPPDTRVANKTGLGQRGRMDAGIVYRGTRPIYILAGFTDRVPPVMPDGLPGFTHSFAVIGGLSRLCWDAIT